MPTSIPTPVAAAVGLVPTVLQGVRTLPAKAVQLPVLAVSSALNAVDLARRGYGDLAERGERLLAGLRGTSLDELEDAVEDALEGTVLAAPYERAEDALEDLADKASDAVKHAQSRVEQGVEQVRDTLGDASQTVEKAVDGAADTASGAVESLGDAADDRLATAAVPPEQAPKGVPTPKATQPDDTRVDTAAAPDVVATVERVAATLGGVVVSHDELPLADYDHMTLGALRGRMRSLDLAQLVQLRDYEKAKADRLPIVTMLDNRIAKLASTAPDSTAPDSGSAPKIDGPGAPLA